MSPVIYNITLAAIFCGIAVKILDDYLDLEFDAIHDRANLAKSLGKGTAVYACLLLALSAVFNHEVGLSLFFASYILGMFNDLKQLLPSKLYSWQESLLIAVLGIVALGYHYMVFSLLYLAALQLIDDCIDLKTDTLCGQRNLVRRFGLIECALAIVILLLLAWWLDQATFVAISIGIVPLYTILSLR